MKLTINKLVVKSIAYVVKMRKIVIILLVILLVNLVSAVSESELKDFLRTEMSKYFQKQETSLSLNELKQTLNFYFTLGVGLEKVDFSNSGLSENTISIIKSYVELRKAEGEFFSCKLIAEGKEIIGKKWWEVWKSPRIEIRKAEQEYIFSLKSGEIKNLGKINIIPQPEKGGNVQDVDYRLNCDSEIGGYMADNYIYVSRN